MVFFKKHSPSCRQISERERECMRTLMRKASRGNAFAFRKVACHYTDFISEYLSLLGYEDEQERLRNLRTVLSDCWSQMPNPRRLVDFESFLKDRLEDIPPAKGKAQRGAAPAHAPLLSINPEERFLLVARVFERWPYRDLRLIMQASREELAEKLMRLKSRLIGFKPNMLKAHEQLQIIRLSELLEGERVERCAHKLEQEIAHSKLALEFKATWLAYQCELIELRQSMRLSESEKASLVDSLGEALKRAPRKRRRIGSSLLGAFSLHRIPAKRV